MIASLRRVRSLLSPHNKDVFRASLCEDFSDLTSPTRNHINLAYISVVLSYRVKGPYFPRIGMEGIFLIIIRNSRNLM